MNLFDNISVLLKDAKVTNTPIISPKQRKPNTKKNKKRRSIKSGYYKDIWCDSGWELAWILYNENHNIQFERNYDKFLYTYKNKKHHYIPDFKLPDDTYIEIKGREPKICLSKYTALPKDKLKILYAKDMRPYLDYVIKRYGKEYWKVLQDKPY